MSPEKQLARQMRVLSAIRARVADAAHSEGEVDVGSFITELRMPRRLVYQSVLALVEAGHLEYLGAGPRVRITPRGLGSADTLLSARRSS